MQTPQMRETQVQKPEKRETVQELQCTQLDAFSTIRAIGGTQMVVNCADYEKDRTTLQIVDVAADAVCREITMDGVWDLKEQTFSDGRYALCNRDTNEWLFLSSSLEKSGIWHIENMDGYFSYDGNTYYYLRDRVLCWQNVNGSEGGQVAMPLDLRLLDLTAFDAPSSTLIMQFYLSPYSSACGTAAYNIAAGTFTMLQKDRYQVSFCKDNLCMLAFDDAQMGYCALYGSGNDFRFADAGIFSDTDGYLFPIAGSPYLMGISLGRSTLYTIGQQVAACSLGDYGINGEMYTACYLPDENLLVGTIYQSGAFHLYTIDLMQLSFTELTVAAPAVSPLAVDESLAQAYWDTVSGTPVAERLQEMRQYADRLEETYRVKILLSTQCAEAAALSDRVITLTDAMSADEELKGIQTMLEALERSLALYPAGFPAQFRNGIGDGGLCFLLVEQIESNYGVVGCTYEYFQWQYIALDVRQMYNLESIICHELWHATENLIFSRDYLAFPYDDWDALNPQEFTYYQDAALALNDPAQKWTLYSSRPEDVHFVDSYACVDQKEDRARIMEYFMVHEDEAKFLIESPFIRQKFQMMCDAVRNHFDTTGWTDVRWERLL